MKLEIRKFIPFVIIAFFASIASGAVVPYIPNFGNPLLTSAIVFVFPFFILWIIWINYGKKAESAVS